MKILFETERLYLREFLENDYTDLCEVLQDIDVMYAFEHSFSEEEVKNWYNKNIERYKKNGFGYWAVIHKNTNDFLGQSGLMILDTNGKEYLEIGYIFKKKHWHKGYATEAALGCKKYAFETLNVKNVYASIRDNNMPSIKVAEKIGMKIIEKINKHYFNMDMLHYIYGIGNE